MFSTNMNMLNSLFLISINTALQNNTIVETELYEIFFDLKNNDLRIKKPWCEMKNVLTERAEHKSVLQKDIFQTCFMK